MSSSALVFIHAFAAPAPVPLTLEIVVHTATEDGMKTLHEMDDAMPYWAFPWPGGQALARYVLDNPESVKGKRVLDFAAGSGVAAIAAAKAGAAAVSAYDIDPVAQAALGLNAALNGVIVKNLKDLRMDRPYKGADVILAGDVCGQQALAARALRWLYLCVAAGTTVLLGDPGRAYVPQSGLQELAHYDVPVMRAVEDCDRREGFVWRLSLPDEA